ncbi:MAG: hypothetical protein Q7T55_10550, partial [Solirubrobacteraceae bacterium]|nr:hypothetical protein [Solirubrobacteraceae bacterium]
MLTRLIRQFGARHLLDVAQILFQHWPPAAGAPVLAWAAGQLQQLDTVAAETFWRWFLPQAARPASCAALQAQWRVQASGANPLAPQAAATMAGPGLSVAEWNSMAHGLEQADFSLLAPVWERLLACAPELLRSKVPQHWQNWLARFDDAVLADILCVVQADCAWLLAALTPVLPAPRRDALLRPALGQWLAASPDSLDPQTVLDWIGRAAPELLAEMETLFVRDLAKSDVPAMVPLAPAAAPCADDEALLAAAATLFADWSGPQLAAALAWAEAEVARIRSSGNDASRFWGWLLSHKGQGGSVATLQHDWQGLLTAGGPGAAAVRTEPPVPAAPAAPVAALAMAFAGAGFSRSEARTIGHGLAHAQFALLAPHWHTILTTAPHCLRAAHAAHCQQWAQGFDDAVLIDLLRVLQTACAQLIDTVAADPQLQPALRAGLQQWLCAPADSLVTARILDWRHRAAQPQTAAPGAPAGDDGAASFHPAGVHALAGLLFSAWPQTQRASLLAWADGEAQRMLTQADSGVAFWGWLLSAYAQQRQTHALSRVTLKRRVVWSLAEARQAIERLAGSISEWTTM